MLPLEILTQLWKKHPIEVILLTLALLITAFTVSPWLIHGEIVSDPMRDGSIVEPVTDIPSPTLSPEKLTIDVSGAVLNPNIYEVSAEARLADVVHAAGGLTTDAAADFIARNFNMARFVSDQEKIYIPTREDIQKGYVSEATVLGQEEAQGTTEDTPAATGEENPLAISINTASETELDTLPGVGPTTAGKIIDNRPYTTLDELLTRKVVSKSVFEKLSGLIKL